MFTLYSHEHIFLGENHGKTDRNDPEHPFSFRVEH